MMEVNIAVYNIKFNSIWSNFNKLQQPVKTKQFNNFTIGPR